MFHTFRDDVRRRITITLSGPVALADVISFLNTQRSRDAWDYSVLYDARGMVVDLPPGDLQLVATHVGELSKVQGRGRVAVVWATEAQRVFVERSAALVQPAGVQLGLFPDMDAADRWLKELRPLRA